MKFRNPYRQQHGFKKGLALLVIGGLIGYSTSHFAKNDSDFRIQNGYIHHPNTSARMITETNGQIQVGTLKERVNDLLYENPQDIKRTVEELYATYLTQKP